MRGDGAAVTVRAVLELAPLAVTAVIGPFTSGVRCSVPEFQFAPAIGLR